MANLKSITELPVAESADGLNLIVNDNGAAKQIPAEFIGKVKTVNGASPDDNGNVEIEIPEGFSGSWNDLKDKPFYTEPKTILERQVIDGFIEGDEVGYVVLLTHKIEYPDDVALTVFWDSIEYNCISVNGILGNTLPTTREDNGVPFIIVKDDGIGNSGIIALAGFDGYTNASHEIGIVGETVHKLDAKYLPDPFWVEEKRTLIVEGVPDENGDYPIKSSLKVGEEYTYYIDDVEYSGECISESPDIYVCFEHTDGSLTHIYDYGISLSRSYFDFTIPHKIERVEKVYHTRHDFMVIINSQPGSRDYKLVAGDFAKAKAKILNGLPITAYVCDTQVDNGYKECANYEELMAYFIDDGEERIFCLTIGDFSIKPDNTVHPKQLTEASSHMVHK